LLLSDALSSLLTDPLVSLLSDELASLRDALPSLRDVEHGDDHFLTRLKGHGGGGGGFRLKIIIFFIFLCKTAPNH
jgi:hypothetical protein